MVRPELMCSNIPAPPGYGIYIYIYLRWYRILQFVLHIMNFLINGWYNNETSKLVIFVGIIEPKVSSGKVEVIISNIIGFIFGNICEKDDHRYVSCVVVTLGSFSLYSRQIFYLITYFYTSRKEPADSSWASEFTTGFKRWNSCYLQYSLIFCSLFFVYPFLSLFFFLILN